MRTTQKKMMIGMYDDDDDDGTHRICSKQLWDTKSNDSLSRMRIRSPARSAIRRDY